ncbi:hypothetical protein AtNW77_Chr2g0258031 [Arabidopsis thaliana]|uniref:Uncharacterized protein n=4 Tax=Arabidopsis TaxID=3701 RepID=A0A178VR20_ARATH|nr:translation initiation factor [Arabidopsis thaliana]KAG7638760.1 hypothetical protein ISN45_At02g031640 [Arabidopsis thaliana x Arabidopsis arenosa]KAG7643367.1 hypothetical protein ISN44_As02g031840 [Arabidopsis suecica]AAM15322.1 Expressed protein [Arabidopsis thaliana]AAM63938.1 unknown [Arabidopsis thaliana]AAN86182.1 unknown protein [Arabidopsis thaliana]|eukprot:NP_565853.1 translation initiation factor [Arabidopsis thaliana]
MAAITGFSALSNHISPASSLPSSRLLNSTQCLSRFSNVSSFPALSTFRRRKIPLTPACSSIVDGDEEIEARGDDENEIRETLMLSVSPLPLLLVASLPGAETVRSVFGPVVEIVKSLNLPDWLVHWGHPGNMAVVLFAMGGYGTYLGFRIRYSDDIEEKAKAKDLHPKLLAGMFFFFALGATGGVISLLTSDKPIFESPHAVTGLIGLGLLTVQTILPSLFKEKPELRNVHGILGSGIMALFLVHAAFGLQLGLSF